MLSTKPAPVNVRCLYRRPELLSQAGLWGRNLYYCNYTWENSSGHEELEEKSSVSRIFILASDLKGQPSLWGQRWTQGNPFLPWWWEERWDTSWQNAPVFQSQGAQEEGCILFKQRKLASFFLRLGPEAGKEDCCSPWCMLENLILPKAALVIFFWTSSQTLPYRKPARANTEISTMLISLGQSPMAVETRQRDQWHTAHTEAKQRCWTQKRKKQTFCVHLPKNIKIARNFWVPRFYGFFSLLKTENTKKTLCKPQQLMYGIFFGSSKYTFYNFSLKQGTLWLRLLGHCLFFSFSDQSEEVSLCSSNK